MLQTQQIYQYYGQQHDCNGKTLLTLEVNCVYAVRSYVDTALRRHCGNFVEPALYDEDHKRHASGYQHHRSPRFDGAMHCYGKYVCCLEQSEFASGGYHHARITLHSDGRSVHPSCLFGLRRCSVVMPGTCPLGMHSIVSNMKATTRHAARQSLSVVSAIELTMVAC